MRRRFCILYEDSIGRATNFFDGKLILKDLRIRISRSRPNWGLQWVSRSFDGVWWNESKEIYVHISYCDDSKKLIVYIGGQVATINIMTDILEGSKQLLNESITLLDNTIEDVIIVGGWGPYLRHSNRHPGTKDVDILFPIKYDKRDMIEIMNRFLANGFFISAKNDFQLCRAYKLGVQTYIYNVDLLHATEGKLNKVDFVDIMDLDVTDGIRVKPLLTINIQYGEEIYSKNLFETIKFDNKQFKVLDAAGIIISKIESCHNKKRQRDIYDIYLSLSEPNALAKVTQLFESNWTVKEEFEKYAKRLKADWGTYEEHLKLFGVDDPDAKNKLLMGL